MNATLEALGDGAVVAKRNLFKIKRVPDLIVFTSLMPIMFVLLFAYVLGSAINTPGVSYREFLMAGIFVQTVVFGATITGSGMAEDIKRGTIDRFRSLPMAGSAVLVGRTTSDLVNNLVIVVIMALTGLVVGWRVHGSVLETIGGVALLLAFAYAISWMMACIGLAVPSPEIVKNDAFVIIFPLTYIANTFVPSDNLPARSRSSRSGTRSPRSRRVPVSCSATFNASAPGTADTWSLQTRSSTR